jgi:hypothetical protein
VSYAPEWWEFGGGTHWSHFQVIGAGLKRSASRQSSTCSGANALGRLPGVLAQMAANDGKHATCELRRCSVLESTEVSARRRIRLVFLLAWALWPVIDGEKHVLADRAATFLDFEQPQAGVVDRQGRLAPSRGPVFSQGGVVR